MFLTATEQWVRGRMQMKNSKRIYFVQGEGAHTEGGQLHRVQQGHLDHTVGLRTTIWPVLVAFYLAGRQQNCLMAGVKHYSRQLHHHVTASHP